MSDQPEQPVEQKEEVQASVAAPAPQKEEAKSEGKSKLTVKEIQAKLEELGYKNIPKAWRKADLLAKLEQGAPKPGEEDLAPAKSGSGKKRGRKAKDAKDAEAQDQVPAPEAPEKKAKPAEEEPANTDAPVAATVAE